MKKTIMRMTMIFGLLALSFLVLNVQMAKVNAEDQVDVTVEVDVTVVEDITTVSASASNLNNYYYDSTSGKYYQVREIIDGESTTYELVEVENPNGTTSISDGNTNTTDDEDEKNWYEDFWVWLVGGILLGLILRKLIK